MPQFKVIFPTPVRYLPDHWMGRDLQVLIVNAPSAAAALQHAIRVTVGDAGEAQVVELYDAPVVAPPAEIIDDVIQGNL